MEVIVNTSCGPIAGQKLKTIYEDEYYSFEQVPFAEPPLGNLRFRAPVPKQKWHETLDCTRTAEKPLQKSHITMCVEGAEDCLYLNVYAKKLNSEKPLPLMVFFFGGGFEIGDPTKAWHSPDYFMMKDVVLVTVSYRVNCLGFLSLSDASLNIPGNAGLKDQLLGLKWIKENAHHFNADPNNITIFGESAGAASTHYLMLSPHAKGLFNKAILMSGSVLCPWASTEIRDLPFRLAKANGYQGSEDESEILEFLQYLKGDDLVRHELLTKEEILNGNLYNFGPVVEPYETDNCMIAKPPIELVKSCEWSHEIPLMVGGTAFEGLYMYKRVKENPSLIENLKEDVSFILPYELRQKYNEKTQRELGEQMLKFYFGDSVPSLEHILQYCNYATYKVFWHPILRTVQERLKSSVAAPTYLYCFDYYSKDFNHERIKSCGKDVQGVAHYDDHSYFFYGDFSWRLPRDASEFKTIETMIDIWTTFALTTNPNCSKIENTNWLPLKDAENLHWLDIRNEGCEYKEFSGKDELELWNSLYQKNK